MTTDTSPNGNPDVPILTVSQITNAIKHSLESTFPLVWLQGEISNLKPHSSGHLYFSLKDANAQISAVMFRPNAATMKVALKDGAQVIVRGEINVYPAGGRYQILVRELRPVGLGELLLKLEELKIKLHQMGWFKSDRKKPLPKFPKTIGVVTSPTGAAIQDMLNILTRRFSGFHLILNPVKVQGEGSAKEIAQAIDQFNAHQLVDVMIIGRGGGSIEDLWAFNEEIVAEAIFRSKIPIISAVGHETDHCIADYVADVRAPTPSAAAEIVIAEKSQQLQHLTQMQKRMQQSVVALIRQDRHRLQGIIRHPLFQTPFGLLGSWIQRLDGYSHFVNEGMLQQLQKQSILLESKKQVLQSLKPTVRIDHYKQKLLAVERNLIVGITNRIKWMRSSMQAEIKQRQLDNLWARQLTEKQTMLKQIKEALDAVNPKNVLRKGYCIVYTSDGIEAEEAISSVKQVKINQELKIQLNDGTLRTTVKEIQS